MSSNNHCVIRCLQNAARDEILASGGSLSHHHGGVCACVRVHACVCICVRM